MVEFGLKLDDNKVSEWSQQYIDYEKLKVILKKAKAVKSKLQDLSKRRPERAAAIQKNYAMGIRTPFTSQNSLSGLEQSQASFDASPVSPAKLASQQQNATEQTALIPKQEDSGAQPLLQAMKGSNEGLTDSERSNTLLRKAVSGVSDYLGRSYERQIRECLKEVDKLQAEFERCLCEQLDKVNAFYAEKLEEHETRHQVLKETVVATMTQAQHHASVRDGEDETPSSPSTPGRQRYHSTEDVPSYPMSPKSHAFSIGTRMIDKFSSMMRSPAQTPQPSRHPKLHLIDDDDDDEWEDPGIEEERRKLTQKRLAEFQSIRRALVDQFRTAKLLQNYVIMNYTGFVKIVKKHDKTFPEFKGKYKKTIAAKAICEEGAAVELLIIRMEKHYADWFCGGNKREAHAQLLPKRGDGLQMDWSQLRLGYRMGMCTILGLWVCWDCVWGMFSRGKSTIGGRTAFPVFRGCGGLLVLQWFWGCSVYVWTRYRINYIYLFDFDPRIVASPLAIFNDAVDNTLVFLGTMLVYYKSGTHDVPNLIPPGGYPFFLVVYTIYRLVFPLKTRKPMWKAVRQVVTAPLTSPSFFHGYIGDIFTSMVKVFQDIAWTLGFVISGDWLISEDSTESMRHEWSQTLWYKHVLIPLVCLFPLLIRFNQCLRRYFDTQQRFPHLANAAKYSMSMTVTLFGAFHPLYLLHMKVEASSMNLFQTFWMALFVSSSLYSFVWDVYMDWGLGRPSYGFLGPRLMFPERIYYFAIIAVDLVLRFMWVLTLVPPQSGASFEVPQYLTALTLMLELFRRTIWGFLRLENEHRSNTAGYRRVGFVPLHFNTGHSHQYQQEKEHRGNSVLAEVAAVSLVVLGISIYSVVAAQHATHSLTGMGTHH